MAGINLKNIWKSYEVDGRRIEVLNGIDLQVPKGRITVILGRSGCGKTTLLRITGGLETVDAGDVISDRNQKTAFVFQEARLMPWLNVWDNVSFSLKKKECIGEKIQNVIDMVGLHGFEKAYPNQLSGGMQQRAAIARALVYEPAFIMMDEPFAALDYFTRNQMQREVIRLQKECGTSILFVTHSIDEALLLADKIVIVENGRIKTEIQIDVNQEKRNLLDSEFILQKRKIIEQLNL